MSLRSDIQQAVGGAFDDALADAVKDFNVLRETSGEYDPVTGTTATSQTTFSGRGVFGSFSQEEVDGQHILATDTKITVLQNELNGTPLLGDDIDDEGFRIVMVMQDPAGATWTIAARRT